MAPPPNVNGKSNICGHNQFYGYGGRMHRKGPSRFFGKKKGVNKNKTNDNGAESIHKRNLHLFAVPLIAVFNILRFIAFQLWLLLSLVFATSQHLMPVKKDDHGESVVLTGDKDTHVNIGDAPCKPTKGHFRQSSGSGEPSLAKQRHHHRQAFEWISRALKIDEEDRGKITLPCKRCIAYST